MRTPRLLLDNDGHNVFRHLSGDFRRDIDAVVRACPRHVTTYLLCCGAGTFYYPTRIAEVDPRCAQLLAAHARGEDPFGYFLGQLRATGRETFVTFRMNDVHDPQETWNVPAVRRRHPDCIVDAAAVVRGDPDWMNHCLDYSRPEVAAYFRSLLEEVVTHYPCDGLQLDWMRFPRHLSGDADEVWAKRDHLTHFMADARALTRSRGMKLIARIPTSLAGARKLGIDLATWAHRGLVDFISTGAFLNTDFFQPIGEMRAAVNEATLPIYAGFDFGHGQQFHCPESLRAACLGLYDSGADGINLFNFPCWREYVPDVPYHWLEGLDVPATAARKPLLFSVAHRHFRAPVDLPWILPVDLAPGARAVVPLRLPALALPATEARLLIKARGPCQLTFNGAELSSTLPPAGTGLFEEHQDPTPPSTQAAPTLPACFRLDPHLLRAGENVLTLSPSSVAAVTVDRINLGLW